MAANDLTNVVPQILAQGLLALRENAITPQLTNRAYEPTAGEKGSTIDVPTPAAITAVEVTAAATPPATEGTTPGTVAIALDQWYEAPFYLTDKEITQIIAGHIPMTVSEAVKSLGNKVDVDLLGQYTKFYGHHGNLNAGSTAYLTPFEDDNGDPTNTKDATTVRKILNNQLAPNFDRHVVFDPDCEAAALNLRAFQDGSYSGDFSAIRDGKLNNKVGFQWWMNQNVQSHTIGTGTGILAAALGVLGEKTLACDTGTGTVVVGDILTFADHSQTYVATAITADVSSGTLTFEPGLQTAVPDNTAVTIRKGGAQNLVFQKGAIAFATRPLVAHGAQLGVISRTIADSVSGLTLRLEITHEHKRVRYSFDILWGKNVVRRELGCRLAGA